jgi:benzoylformate decarboxylase
MPKITGRSAFLTLLADEGVKYLFGNPGTTELPIMEALGYHPEIQYVLGLQEAIVVAMADGYARATGEIGACNVHVAPGLGNAMGSLYSAKFYGSPVIVTAGQQEQGHGLKEPMLYHPLVPIAQPLVKWAVEVTRVEDLPRIVRRAAKVATTAPMGPVFISLPGDILDAEDDLDLGRSTRIDSAVRPSDEAIDRLAARLLGARNPVIVSGHEIALTGAWEGAARVAELLGAPVYQQTSCYGAHFSSEHPAFMGALTRVQHQVQEALRPHDVGLFLGGDVLKMSVHAPINPWPETLAVCQVGERDWDIAKNYPVEIALRANVRETLNALAAVLVARRISEQAGGRASAREIKPKNWTARRARLAGSAVLGNFSETDRSYLTLSVSETLPVDAVLVDEALTTSQSLLWFLRFRHPGSFFGNASGGIGWAMGAAIGVALGMPGRPVVATIGDGSSMYSIQALWTAANLKLPLTYVIANNRSYRILKERLVSFRRTEKFIGMDFRDPPLDFVGLAHSMGMRARRIEDPADIVPARRGDRQRSAQSARCRPHRRFRRVGRRISVPRLRLLCGRGYDRKTSAFRSSLSSSLAAWQTCLSDACADSAYPGSAQQGGRRNLGLSVPRRGDLPDPA